MSQRRSDVASVALGSGVVLAAGAVDQVARLTLTGLLAAQLGAEGFGTWTLAFTITVLLGTFALMGLQSGVVLFGARGTATGDDRALAGAVWGAVGSAALSAAVIAAGVALIAPDSPVGKLLFGLAPAVWLHAVLLMLVSVGRAIKDLRIQAMTWQGLLPVGLLLGSMGALAGAWSMPAAFVGSYTLSVVVAAALVWRRLGHVLRGPATFDVPGLLRFSAPQGVAEIVYRLTVSIDVLMLGHLASAEDVGGYRVAASIAFVASVPVMAVHNSVTPHVAELLHLGERARLDALLKTVTRWLVLGAAPLYLALIPLGDAALGWLDGAYVAAAPALVILLLGQAVHVACAVMVPVVPMTGRSGLEMANGVASLALAVALNFWLIPVLGPLGAAIASAAGFSMWAALRVVEAWWLVGVFPFDRRTLGVIAFAFVAGGVVSELGSGASLVTRGVYVALALLSYGAMAFGWGLTEGDRGQIRSVLRRVRQRLAG